MSARARFRWQLAVLLGFVLCCSAVFAVLYRAGGGRLPGDGGYQVQAVVPDAVSLSSAADVRAGGVRVGRVEEIATRATSAVLMLRIDEDHAPVYRDARVQVRLKSLVGENYVELDPGTPSSGAVADGGVLPLENADQSTQLDQILSVFDRRSRGDLRRVLDEVGGGLRGRGRALNRTLATAGATVDQARPVVELLQRQRSKVAGMIDDVGRVMRALGDRRRAIRVLAHRAKGAAEAIAARDRKLADTIGELPATLRQARSTTTRLGSFSSNATPVLDDLAGALEELEPALRRLEPTARSTRTTVAQLGRFARRGAPMTSELRRVGNRTTAAMPSLDRALREFVPLVDYLAPYHRELGAFFANLRSMSNGRDATGNLARLHGIVSPSSVIPANDAQKRLLDSLFSTGILSKARTNGHNAYPEPGAIGKPKPFRRAYPRVSALPPLRRAYSAVRLCSGVVRSGVC